MCVSVFTQNANIKSVIIQMEVDAFFLNSVTANNASANRDGCEEQMSRPSPTATSAAMTDVTCVSQHQALFGKRDVNYTAILKATMFRQSAGLVW